MSRQVLEQISSNTGWIFVVDNKPGVGGNIGLDAVAKSKPDGYTLGMAQTANLAINPALYRKMPYDARKDFSAIGLVASQAVMLVVRNDSPYRTVGDLIADARSRPGRVTMASAGAGTTGHLAGELLARRAGVQWTHVPYRGFGLALNDIYGGQTDFMVTSPQSSMSQLKAGKLRALAVSSPQRVAVLPQVPTIAESGYAGFEAMDWKGMVGPAGMPPAVVATLNAELQKALAAPALVGKLGADGGAALGGTASHMTGFVGTELMRWGDAVRESGATAN